MRFLRITPDHKARLLSALMLVGMVMEMLGVGLVIPALAV